MGIFLKNIIDKRRNLCYYCICLVKEALFVLGI